MNSDLVSFETDEADFVLAARTLERLLEHVAGSLALGRVEDAVLPEPERDVVCLAGWAEADEVAPFELALPDWLRGGLLLVGVPRNEAAEPAVGHVHEAGAVDPALGHPAPLVRRAEIGLRLRDWIAVRTRLGQPGPGDCPPDLAQMDGANPAGVVIRGPHSRPVAVRLLDGERLAAERLGHLLGRVVGLG